VPYFAPLSRAGRLQRRQKKFAFTNILSSASASASISANLPRSERQELQVTIAFLKRPEIEMSVFPHLQQATVIGMSMKALYLFGLAVTNSGKNC
jgi:hypothetical protein